MSGEESKVCKKEESVNIQKLRRIITEISKDAPNMQQATSELPNIDITNLSENIQTKSTGPIPSQVQETQVSHTGPVPNPVQGTQTRTTGSVPNPVKKAQTSSTGPIPNPVQGTQTSSTGPIPNPVQGMKTKQMTSNQRQLHNRHQKQKRPKQNQQQTNAYQAKYAQKDSTQNNSQQVRSQREIKQQIREQQIKMQNQRAQDEFLDSFWNAYNPNVCDNINQEIKTPQSTNQNVALSETATNSKTKNHTFLLLFVHALLTAIYVVACVHIYFSERFSAMNIEMDSMKLCLITFTTSLIINVSIIFISYIISKIFKRNVSLNKMFSFSSSRSSIAIPFILLSIGGLYLNKTVGLFMFLFTGILEIMYIMFSYPTDPGEDKDSCKYMLIIIVLLSSIVAFLTITKGISIYTQNWNI